MQSYLNYIFITLVFVPLWINAQVFPVQATPQLIPPYSLKLSEYSTTSSEKLLLNLLLTDISESNRQVTLKLHIENNSGIAIQSSDVVVGANPVFLDGGVPLRLTNIDLQPYFSLQNLQGITPQQYSVPLPEGFYRFCFEVYDATSGKQISRKSCVPVYLVLNDPPFLNIPQREEQVLMRDPQNIIFQWTPRHLNATNVSYEFTLTELWDNQMDPQAAFLAGRPLYQTTTFATTLLYGPTETSLLADKMYAWRVRAMVSDGISENAIFKNDGYSEIYHFTYSGKCNAPKALFAEAKNKTTQAVYWEGIDHKSFMVQYRKKSGSESDANQTNQWFETITGEETTTVYKLEPNTTYEYRVGGQCIDKGPFTYSQINTFTTPIDNSETSSVDCGVTPNIDITNQEPLIQIIRNEVFTAGDFPVTVKEIVAGNVRYLLPNKDKTEEEKQKEIKEAEEAAATLQVEESTDGQGIYSGWGYIEVPYLNGTKIKVSFEGIKINTDYQLIEGVVQTDYDKNWGGLASVNDVLDLFEGNNDLVNVDLNFDIEVDDISIAPDGQVVITDPRSNNTTKYPGGGDMIIMDTNEDNSRDIFHVDADGNISKGGQLAPGGAINPENTAGVDSNGEVIALTAQGIQVDFVNDSSYTYGFDWLPEGQGKILGQYYKQIKDIAGAPYPIINKAVGNGAKDIIKARVTITDGNLSITDLVIKTIHGENVPYQVLDKANGIISLELNGYYAFEHQNIYATIQSNKNKTDKQTIAGVFSQWHLSDKEVNLTIVPVDSPSLPEVAQLEANLNKIFLKASVRFKVMVAGQITSGLAAVAVGDSGLTSNYTEDQKKIINQFKQIRKTDPKSYYVFVLGKNTRPSRNVAGFMPIQRQFGFVFTSNLSVDNEEGKSSLQGTLAHELGHGVFGLEHPFTQLKTTQGATDWLLDYGNGTKFAHLDWTQIHNPTFKLYKFLFFDDLDGALAVSALTPSGAKLEYTGDGAIVFTDEIPEYSNGAVFAILEDGKLYEWEKNSDNNEGYYRTKNQLKALSSANVRRRSLSDNSTLQLYWNKGSCELNEIYTTTFDVVKNYLVTELPSRSERLTIDLNNDIEYKDINLVSKAGCSNDPLCGNIAMVDLQPEIDELTRIGNAINALRDVPSAATIAKNVYDLSICGLRKLDYTVVKALLTVIMFQSTFSDKDVSEEAIVKLLLCIPADHYSDFVATLVRRNGNGLDNVISQMTNRTLKGLSEAGENTFFATLTQIVAGSDDEVNKWVVFNSTIRAKLDKLLEEPIVSLQLGILKSLRWKNEAEANTMSSVYNMFVAMLTDPNLPSLEEYKIVFDIAKLRFDEKQKFARFTMTDFITLRMRDLNDFLLEPEVKQLYSLEHIPNTSWIFPVPSERFGVLLPKVEQQDLYNNFTWSRYIRNTKRTIEQLTQDPKTFLEIFYEQLLLHVEDRNQGNGDFWRAISAISCENIIDIITHINLNENRNSLQEVGETIKKQVLRAYFDCDFTTGMDDRTQLVEGAENSVMKIVSSFPPEDRTILATLEEIGFATIKRKLGRVGFNEFIVWVGMQIKTSGKVQVPIRPYGLDLTDASKLYQLEANIFQLQNFSADLAGNQIEIQGQRLAYNQLIMVHVRGSFDFLGTPYKQGAILTLPLIEVYAMSENNQRTVVWNSAFLAADVVSVVMPIAGGGLRLFRLAGHTVTKTIMAADIAASTASAIVTALNQDAIDQDLRFKIQMASLATTVPSLFSSLPRAELQALKNRTNQALDDLTDEIGDQDVALLKSSYGGEAVSGIVNSSRIPDDLQEAFKRDFGDLRRADDMNETFLEGWVNYRKNYPDAIICN